MNWESILQRQQGWTIGNADELRLSIEEASEIYENAPLHELTMAADIRRKKLHPDGKVTYLVDRNVNYTNVCTINCQFCSFYRPPGHDETYTQSFEEISQRINELEDIGGSRILMQGGVNPDLEFSWYLDLISYLVKNHPDIHLDCFSPIEIEGIAEVSGMTTLEVLTQLQAVGLHGLPGGGAEMLVEEVRKDISPKKGNPDNWLRVMQEAQSHSDLPQVQPMSLVLVKHLGKEFSICLGFVIFKIMPYKITIMVSHHSLRGPFSLSQTLLAAEIEGRINMFWVLVQQNIYDILLYLAYFLITLRVSKRLGLLWALVLLKWHCYQVPMTQVQQ